MSLSPPFPWYGGKRRAAAAVWDALGDPGVYIEPFAGSLAVLLARRAPGEREVVGDTDGLICNFWRAVRLDPEGCARWADYPTIDADLQARQAWLVDWRARAPELLTDPEWFDVQAAGWWVWGASAWIGGDWCVDAGRRKIPAARSHPLGGGRGVMVQRATLPGQIPWMGSVAGAGRGIAAQRRALEAGGEPGDRLLPWFRALAARLARVIVLHRSWETLVGPSMVAQSGPRHRRPDVGVFLDPPYLTGDRKLMYASDVAGESDEVARASWAWAALPRPRPDGTTDPPAGEVYRVVYCCHAGDFDWPAGWRLVESKFKGVRRAERRRERRDVLAFSPACLAPRQGRLVD